MKELLLKFMLLVFWMNIVSHSISQKLNGTYQLVINPKDAPPYPGDEFPVYGYQATFQLKWFHQLKYTVTDAVGDNPRICLGKWEYAGKTIHMSSQTSDSLVLQTFEVLKLKSGIYIKPVNDYFHYYKKQ